MRKRRPGRIAVRVDSYSVPPVQRQRVSGKDASDSNADPARRDDENGGAEAGVGDETVAASSGSEPTLEGLSLPERIVAAWFQDPVRGIVVVFLLLFALSFLVAFAMWLV